MTATTCGHMVENLSGRARKSVTNQAEALGVDSLLRHEHELLDGCICEQCYLAADADA